ncbi:unnamed protein product, partial [Brassica napus]
ASYDNRVHELWSTNPTSCKVYWSGFHDYLIPHKSFTCNYSISLYEKLITSERFRGRIHFEFDKCIACEVCVRVCPIDLPVVDWKFETNIQKKKRLLNYSIDFGICIFCGNCVEYCPTNCLSMTEEYEFSTYDRHELNYNQIALGRLPMSVIDDYTIRTILNSPQKKKMGKPI